MATKNIPPKDPATGKFVKTKDKEEVNYVDVHKKDSDELIAEDVIKNIPDKEEVVEEPIKEEPVKEPEKKEPEVPLEEVIKKTKEDTVKEMTDKIVTSLTGKDATAEQKDRYQQIAEEFLAKHGRNPTWFELIPYIKEDLKADLAKEQEVKAKEIETKNEQQKKANEEWNKSFNEKIDSDLRDLYTLGKLPRIVNKDDKNDLGVKSRMKLFQTMMDVNTKRVKAGQQPIFSIKEIFYEHYSPPDQQPAGADAPISAGRGSSTTGQEEQEIDYMKDVRGTKTFLDYFKK